MSGRMLLTVGTGLALLAISFSADALPSSGARLEIVRESDTHQRRVTPSASATFPLRSLTPRDLRSLPGRGCSINKDGRLVLRINLQTGAGIVRVGSRLVRVTRINSSNRGFPRSYADLQVENIEYGIMISFAGQEPPRVGAGRLAVAMMNVFLAEDDIERDAAVTIACY